MQRYPFESPEKSTRRSDQREYYAPESPYQPSKRVKRLFYDPERVTGIDRVFCEYDWRTNTFSPTLREVSPPQVSPAHFLSHNTPRMDETVYSSMSEPHVQNSMNDRRIQASRASSAVPRSCTSQVPDETLISHYLLSTSPSSLSPSLKGINTTSDPWISDVFSTSPISRAGSTFSPLQQSIMAYAEQDAVASGLRHSTFPELSARQTSFRPHDDQCMQRQTSASSAFSDSDAYQAPVPKSSAEASAPSLGLKEVGHAKAQSSSRLCTDAHAIPPKPSVRPSGFLRRRSSAPKERNVPPIVYKARSKSESRFDQNPYHRVHFPDDALSGHADEEAISFDDSDAEDVVDDDGARRTSSKGVAAESRFAGLVSAIHYQYVSVGMRIQLAVHRTEKKVVRKLSGRWRQATA